LIELKLKHKIFRDVLPSQSLGKVLRKLNLTQQKLTYTNKHKYTITQNNPKKLNLTQINCNTQHNHRKAKSNQQTTVRSVHIKNVPDFGSGRSGICSFFNKSGQIWLRSHQRPDLQD